MFSNFDEYMGEKHLNKQVVSIIQQHLQSQIEYFDFYFPSEEDPRPRYMWILNPFRATSKRANLLFRYHVNSEKKCL